MRNVFEYQDALSANTYKIAIYFSFAVLSFLAKVNFLIGKISTVLNFAAPFNMSPNFNLYYLFGVAEIAASFRIYVLHKVPHDAPGSAVDGILIAIGTFCITSFLIVIFKKDNPKTASFSWVFLWSLIMIISTAICRDSEAKDNTTLIASYVITGFNLCICILHLVCCRNKRDGTLPGHNPHTNAHHLHNGNVHMDWRDHSTIIEMERARITTRPRHNPATLHVLPDMRTSISQSMPLDPNHPMRISERKIILNKLEIVTFRYTSNNDLSAENALPKLPYDQAECHLCKLSYELDESEPEMYEKDRQVIKLRACNHCFDYDCFEELLKEKQKQVPELEYFYPLGCPLCQAEFEPCNEN